MECLNLRFVRTGSKNTVRTARTPHRPITAEGVCLHSVKWADQYQIGSNGSINNYDFTDELVLTEGEILQYVLLLVAFNKILEYLPTSTTCFTTFYCHISCPGLSKSVE